MTLLEDLDIAAQLLLLHDADVDDLAARLRAHAERLRREIELSASSSEYWNSHVTAVLERINNGPIRR